jgi:Immunity protein 51
VRPAGPREPFCAEWHTVAVKPMRIVETSSGEYSLVLDAATTDVDEVIEELGHGPNGYFWEGIAQLLVDGEASHLEGRFDYDPEAEMFVAHGPDRRALEELAALMTAVATDADRLRRLVALADQRGFEFDD